MRMGVPYAMAIYSLAISYELLGTREWFVTHHANSGMELFNDEIIRVAGVAWKRRATTARLGKTPGEGKG
jgi:carbonic anhydrase